MGQGGYGDPHEARESRQYVLRTCRGLKLALQLLRDDWNAHTGSDYEVPEWLARGASPCN